MTGFNVDQESLNLWMTFKIGVLKIEPGDVAQNMFHWTFLVIFRKKCRGGSLVNHISEHK